MAPWERITGPNQTFIDVTAACKDPYTILANDNRDRLAVGLSSLLPKTGDEASGVSRRLRGSRQMGVIIAEMAYWFARMWRLSAGKC